MQCPICRELRYSKEWKPSQWSAWRAEVNEFNCCKVCSEDGYVAKSLEEQKEATQRVHKLYDTFMFCTTNGWRPHLKLFLEYWVASSHRLRKYLSYYGAIKRSIYSRHGGQVLTLPDHGANPWGDKCKFIDPNDYFDPGNWHYNICIVLLFGDVPWNAETVGDIVESILGLRYLIEEESMICDNFPFAFANFLELWCVAVYRWFECTAWRDTGVDAVRAALIVSERL